jgi:hypothetical protein
MSFFGPTRCGWGLSPRGPYLRMSRAQPLCVEGAVTMEASHHVAMGWLGDERSCKTDCCCCCRRRCRRGVCGGEYITRGAHRTLPLNLYPPTCLLYLCRLPCLGTHTHTRARSFSHAFYILHPALARSLSLYPAAQHARSPAPEAAPRSPGSAQVCSGGKFAYLPQMPHPTCECVCAI